MSLGVGLGLNFHTMKSGVAAPRGPSFVDFTAGPGTLAGSIRIDVVALPTDLGDAFVYNDGLGILTDIQVSLNGGDWISIGTEMDSQEFPDFGSEEIVDVVVRPLGYFARPGQQSSAQVSSSIADFVFDAADQVQDSADNVVDTPVVS